MPINQLIFGALNRALKTSHFHRDGGAEEQAGKMMEDYFPGRKDLFIYWEKVIEFLMSMAGEHQSTAQGIIIGKFKSQYVEGNRDAIFAAIKKVIERTGGLTNELRQQFTDLTTDRFPISKEQRDSIQELLDGSKPKDIKNRIVMTVIEAPYQSKRTNTGYVDVSSEKARQFARELVESKDLSWLSELEGLQRGEQRQTFSFAQEIGKKVESKDEIIDKAIAVFSEIKFEEQNESFISGLISGINNEDFTRSVVDRLLAHPNTKFHAVRLSRFLTIKFEDLDKLIPVAMENPNYISGFHYLKYATLSDAEIIKFFTWLSQVSSAGNWLAIELIQELLSKSEERLSGLKDLVISLVSKTGLTLTDPPYQLSFFHFELLVSRLINDGINKALIVRLTEEIREACAKFVMSGEFNLRSILFQLLDKYWDVAWPIIGSAMLDTTFEGWHGIKSLLSGYRKFEDHNLLEWIVSNQPNAPIFALMFLEFEASDKDGKPIWTPIVAALINNYGSDQRVLQELSARLHSYSIVGSGLPLFRSRQQLVSILLSHANETVRSFAQGEFAYFERRIEKEKKWSENYDLGELW